MLGVFLEPGQSGLGQQVRRGRTDVEREPAEERTEIVHVPREQLCHALFGGRVHPFRDRVVGMCAQPLPGVFLEKIGARPEDQRHAVALVEGQTGAGHGNVPGVLAAGIVVLYGDSAVFIQHEQLGFVFKTVGHAAHCAEPVAVGSNPGLVRVGQLNTTSECGRFVGRQLNDDDPVGVTGKGRALIPHTLVFISHLMHGAVDVELTPVVGDLGEVMTEMDEDVAECLVGAEVLAFVTEALDGHASSGPETDLIKLDPLDVRAAEEHRSHRSVPDRQRFGHPGLCRPIIPQAQFSRGVCLGWVFLHRGSHAHQWLKAQRCRGDGGADEEATPRNGIRWSGRFVFHDADLVFCASIRAFFILIRGTNCAINTPNRIRKQPRSARGVRV